MNRLVTGVCLWLVCQLPAFAADAEIQGIRLWSAPDHTRVVFDTSSPIEHQLFSLQAPERVVIDVTSATLGSAVRTAGQQGGLVKGIRTAQRDRNTLRIVLDLERQTRPRSFTLKPGGQYGNRLVVDLFETGATKPRSAEANKPVLESKPQTRDLIIAIDAGHGGEDPGAIGRSGTREKDVVLSIARRLESLIKAEPGMRPVLIRQGDYYIGLRQRIDKARKHRADLFVSIHADGFHDRRVQGSSVFVLSRRGATSEMARWLAARENASDLAGGVSLDDKDDLLAEVLLDLSQTATIEASIDVARNMLQELQRVGKTHKSSVQQAGFVVLKSPDIPSVLVETAFISNPAEENKLRDARHQDYLARAMLRGIQRYFSTHPLPGTHRLAREHTIKRGDTLGEIAQQYQVSMSSLKGYNDLKSDILRVGDTLRIPPSGS